MTPRREKPITNVATFSRAGVSSQPQRGRFECSDCGRLRLGSLRGVCGVCGAAVCDYCDQRHERQHPNEATR